MLRVSGDGAVSVNTYAATGSTSNDHVVEPNSGRMDRARRVVLAPLSFSTYLAGAVIEQAATSGVLIMLVCGAVGWFWLSACPCHAEMIVERVSPLFPAYIVRDFFLGGRRWTVSPRRRSRGR